MKKIFKVFSGIVLSFGIFSGSSFASTTLSTSTHNLIPFSMDGVGAKNLYDSLTSSPEVHTSTEHVTINTHTEFREFDQIHFEYAVKTYSALDQSFTLRCTQLPYKTFNAIVGSELLFHYVCEGNLKLTADENNKMAWGISHFLNTDASIDLIKALGMGEEFQKNKQPNALAERGDPEGLMIACKVLQGSFEGCSIEVRSPLLEQMHYVK